MCVQHRNRGTGQIPAVHPEIGQLAMPRHFRSQRGQDCMLRFIGRPRHGLEDQVGRAEFHDVPLVAGERPTAALAPVAHLRVAELWLTTLRDATQNASPTRRRIRLEILRQHGAECGQRVLQRWRRLRR